MRNKAVFYLNGERKEVQGAEVFSMFAEWLRKDLELTGTKIVCAEGDCGACTVLRAFSIDSETPLSFEMMNSCIATVGQMDGAHLVTVEGVQLQQELSPVQRAMQECHGSQCGYCTPGFVMALSGAFEKHETLNSRKASHYLTGNLCRCTGYQPILEAAAIAKRENKFLLSSRYLPKVQVDELNQIRKESVLVQFGEFEFFSPVTLKEAVDFKFKHPDCRILGAGTDWGVQVNKGAPVSKKLLSLHLIPELYELKKNDREVSVGARVTLSQTRRGLKKAHPEFSSFLDLFASPQIKNVATLVGNIANGSPIGDTLPFLLISQARVRTVKWNSKLSDVEIREIAFESLYVGYKKLALEPTELITHVIFDLPHSDQVFKIYKASQRKDLDISTVSAAFSARFKKDNKSIEITDFKMAMGGVAATPIRLLETEKVFIGKAVTHPLIEEGLETLLKEIKPLSDLRGSSTYRKVLAANFLKRFAEEVWQ